MDKDAVDLLLLPLKIVAFAQTVPGLSLSSASGEEIHHSTTDANEKRTSLHEKELLVKSTLGVRHFQST